MKLEEQVTSLELSKKLKSLGVKQDGHFSWTPSGLKRKNEGHGYNRLTIPDAFTVAELGEMLPSEVEGRRLWSTKKWKSVFWSTTESRALSFDDISEANSRAKMLIYLIEKGIIKP